MEIRRKTFGEVNVIECKLDEAVLMITVDFGPRICFYGKDGGENLLYWDMNGYEQKDWKLYGGHRVWITRPMADESEDTYAPDNDACMVEIAEGAVTVEAPASEAGIVRGMIIEESDLRGFNVTNYIRNDGNFLYSGGVWSPTCMNPEGGKKFAVAIGDDGASWDLVKVVIPRKFNGSKIAVNDPQIRFNEDFMIVTPKGTVAKRCLYSAHGIVAMTWPKENLTFIKKVKSIRDGNYQMGGCNTAVFVGADNFMVEMETYGEEQTIIPGETISHTEGWLLRDMAVDFDSFKKLQSSIYNQIKK